MLLCRTNRTMMADRRIPESGCMGEMKSSFMSARKGSWPRLIESLAHICGQYATDRKIFLVQNHHAGQVILQSLARCAGGWLNLRAMTLTNKPFSWK
jgi:hypothetical protein